MRAAPIFLMAAALAGCVAADPPPPPQTPEQSHRSEPATGLPDAAVAYVRAWAANDVATMVRNSAAASPARAFARYWGDVYEAGRLDAGQADVTLQAGTATLTYDDGTQYVVRRVEDSGGGLVTWSARPGGPLAPRIVAGPAVSGGAGGITVTALRQYVNSEGGLRVSLRVSNRGEGRRDLFADGYVGKDGNRSTATLGAGSRTGVIRVSGDSDDDAALASVEDAQPGGQLAIAVVDARGSAKGRLVLALPS